jgi:serine/threonine protein kinase
MELLDGPNLEQYVREYRDQRIPWREALALMLPALEALHAIHERGYVHRDIKPGNILVTRDPGHPPTAIVIDLGLVKPDRALRTADSPPTTEVGRMLCTPGYTSPEQALGRPVDRRSDVYSMAITLYRVLAGRLPFHEVHGKHIAAVLTRHIYYEPTQLADAAATANIPPGVAAVVESALRKDPTQRPQTMLEFAEALRAAADAVSVAPRRRRAPRLHLVMLALGLGVAVTWLVTPRTVCPTAPAPQSAALMGSPLLLSDPLNPSSGPRDPEPPISESTPQAPADPGPAPAVDDRSRVSTDAPKRSSPTQRDSTRRRILARHLPDIQRCADKASISLERLSVRVSVDKAGHVSASVLDAAETPLSRCIDTALKQTTLPSGGADSFVHTFVLPTHP